MRRQPGLPSGKFDPSLIDIPALLTKLGIDARHDGTRWVATCPSGRHRDSKPSWDIKDDPDNPRHGLHSCLGCRWSGTSVDLVAHVLGISIGSAYDWVRERATGRPTPFLRARVELASLTRPTFQLPPGVEPLLPLQAWAGPARDYVESRGITALQVERWRLTYATHGKLAGRLVMPTHDQLGRVVNYVARTYCAAPKRYLFPRREEGPDMGAVWGELHWPPDRGVVVVTEGAINAMAVERVLCPGVAVAALSGSAVQLSQILRLSSFRRAVLLTDPDAAGDSAASRIEQALIRHVEVVRVRLPRKTDAQSLGPDDLLRHLERAGAL